jgi:hypothetical protein
MAKRIHEIQQFLDSAMSKEQSLFKRALLAPALFFVFFIHAVVYSVSVLFFPKQKSFEHVHNMQQADAQKDHVDSHHQWTKRVRVGSLASLVFSVAITSAIVSAFSGGLPTFAAVNCTADIDVQSSPIDVDAFIAGEGGCDNLTITTSGATTEATVEFLDGEVDLTSGGTLTIDSGVTIVFSGALNYPNGDVINDGTITHSEEDTTGVTITAENVENNGTIDVSAKGCQAETTDAGHGPDATSFECVRSGLGAARGSTSTGGGSGGSHGGYGGESVGEPRDSYDSNLSPALLGASGASVNRGTGHLGGDGGGLVLITATDTFSQSGTIAADASDAIRANGSGGSSLYGASAGAGGSVAIQADTIDMNSGVISANGSDGGTNTTVSPGGGGGGGRIALRYTSSASYDGANVNALGGTGGSTSSGASSAEDGMNGSVVVLDETNDAYEIYSGFTFGVSGEELGTVDNPIDSLYIDAAADEMHCEASATDVDVYAQDLEWDGTVNCGNDSMLTFDITTTGDMLFGDTAVLNMNDEEMVLTLNSPADLTLDGVDVTMARGGWLDVQPYNTDAIAFEVAGDSVLTANMRSINVLSDFVLGTDATLSASGIGCQLADSGDNGYTPDDDNICAEAIDGIGGGESLGDGPGGGGYGGAGSDGDTGAGGDSYGTQWRPEVFGSAGGNSGGNEAARFIAFGGEGAGAIMIQTPDMTLDGSFLANGIDGTVGTGSGNSGETGGGGSGGTVHLSAATCSSSASFESVGGAGQTGSQGESGSGGGGRVRLACADADNTLTATVAGGTGTLNSAEDGSAIGDQLEVPYVFIAFPTPDAHNVDINPTLRALEFDANGGWPTADRRWEITDADGTVVYSATTDPFDTDLEVVEANGTFSDGATALEKETVYTLTVIDTNHRGEGSVSHNFTTVYEDATLAAEVTFQWPFDDSGNYAFFAAAVEIVGDSLAKLVDLGSATYTTGSYTDVQIDASSLQTNADFWFEMSESLGATNSGSVRYQIGNDSDDDGTLEWYYVDYSTFQTDYDPTIVPEWTQAATDPDETNTNTAQEMDYYAPDWTDASGKSGEITIRAYLLSDGAQLTEVDTTSVVVSNNDRDGDGYDDVASGGDDCDDTDATVNPGAEETWYDGIDQDCDGADDYDQDGDGFVPDEYSGDSPLPGGDCNDTDAAINPDAEEIWYDGIDQNCDGADDYDQDGDGFVPDEYSGDSPLPGGDCNDTDAAINPDAEDVYYDGVDSNCDGASDYDADEDGFDSDAFGGDDCDDSDAQVNPDATEIYYDGIDQNCDGASDFDADEDGYDSDNYEGDDCNDSDFDVNPGAEDVLVDGIDQDCDGQDGPDQDGDGFSDSDAGGNDCNDSDSSIYPGAEEIDDDGIDQDCDGVDGEGQDNDGDGFAGEDVGGVDCDDNNPLVFPASPDGTRNAVDENCDGVDGPFIVDRVTGTERGLGVVTVYAPDGSIHYTYEAFQKRGVYPVLLEYQDRYFVASVHWRYGRVLKVHELRAPALGAEELLESRRISPTKKRRRMDFDLLGRSEKPHIVLSTIRGNIRRGQKRRLKIIRFRPNRTKSLRTIRTTTYRVRRARKKIGNRINIIDNRFIEIKLKRRGKFRTVFVWNPKVK